MIRFATLGSGLLALLILAILCTARARATIETDLRGRGGEALTEAGQNWAQLGVSGCVLTLGGDPPSLEAERRATRLLNQLPGVCRLLLRDSATGISSVVKTRVSAPAPSLLLAVVRSEEVFRLDGTVPDTRTRNLIIRRVEAFIGSARVEDELRVEAATASENWSDAALSLINAVGPLLEAHGSLDNRVLEIHGIAASGQTAENVRLSVSQNLPSGYRSQLQIAAVDEKTPVDRQTCQQLLRHLARSGLRFVPSSGEIERASFPLLDWLAITIDRCPDTTVEILAHSDDHNGTAALSQGRADAVRTYLIQTGVSPHRISAIGYGTGSPIGDKAAADEQAQDNHIEFEIQ